MPQVALTSLFQAATPFLAVTGLRSPTLLWRRDVEENDDRRGPWKAGTYRRLDESTWSRKGSCLYIVKSSDGGFRYVGVSNRGITQRWKEARAFEPESGQRLPTRQIFHRPCWKNIQMEIENGQSSSFEVRALFASELAIKIRAFQRADLEALCRLSEEEIVNETEKWFRAYRDRKHSTGFLGWNKN